LRAFSLDASPDPYKPKATAVLKHVTAGPTTQTDATSFESGNSTIDPTSVTMHQYSTAFAVSNTDLQSGLRMEDLRTLALANFSNSVIEAATAPITVGNFGAATVISSSTAFGLSDLATLQAALKKSPVKNLILDGAYVARIANNPGFFQKAGNVGGPSNGWAAYGWDGIYQNSDWTGAGTGVVGFACAPQAIAGVVGLPAAVQAPGGILEMKTAVIPGLDISVAVYRWMNPATRTMWCSYDVMAGFTVLDTTAGFIVTSS
jgi:hypothetical protein